jgi:threonine synthase
LAGACHDIRNGKIPEGSRIVCTLTGVGLKDPDTAIKQCAAAHPLSIDAELDAVKRSILDNM